MGNLGKYQDIVAAAKHVGGVDNFIEMIQVKAVAKEFPKIFGKGVGAGALATLGATGVVVVARRRVLESKEAGEALARAKDQFKNKVEESMNSDGANFENGENDSEDENENDSDEGKQP